MEVHKNTQICVDVAYVEWLVCKSHNGIMRLLLVSFWTIKAVIAEMFFEIVIILTPIAEQAR